MKSYVLIEKFIPKTCHICDVTYPFTNEFFKPDRRACRSCHRRRTKDWVEANKLKFFRREINLFL